MNVELRVAVIQKYGSQIAACKPLGFKENRLSNLVRGWYEPTEQELARLTAAFGEKRVKKMFPRAPLREASPAA